MKKNSLRIFIAVLLSIALFVLIMRSFSPFGVKAIYNFTAPNSNWIMHTLGITSVNNLGEIDPELKYLAVDSDQASFSLRLPPSPKKVSSANISLSFQTDQQARIGIKNTQTGTVESVAFFEPTIQDLSWTSINHDELSLYQKNNTYSNIDDFIADKEITDNDGLGVGVFDYQLQPLVDIPDASEETFQTTSILRGAHTFYVYVNKDPLKINLSKVDLNQYVGKDETNIVGFQGDKNVLYTKIEDDGIEERTLETGGTQNATIEKKLPTGVYKIIIDSTIDSVITSLSINQNLVVFENVFFADNPEIYPVAKAYKDNELFTDSNSIDFILGHESQKQNIKINNEEFAIDKENRTVDLNQNLTSVALLTDSSSNLSSIQTSTNDLRISSKSVFSFTRNAFFKPFLSSTTDISATADIANIKYIIAKYKKATEDNGWYHQEVSIPLNIDTSNDKELEFSIFSNERNKAKNTTWLKIKDLRITLE